MKRLVILACLLVATSSAFPWSRFDQPQNSYLYPAESSTQSKLDDIQRRLDQAELERQMKDEEQRAAAEEQRAAAEEAKEAARREAEERAQQARQEAEDRAAEVENRERIASASYRTLIYEALAFLAFVLASYKIVRDKRHSKESALKPHEKAGVVFGVVGGAILLCALFVSSPGLPQLDFWQNLMFKVMTIEFWPYVPTKFVVLPCIGLVLYGAMVYLEILRAPKILLTRFE